jgi:transcriptional regulator with XRE-family HTH domain
MAKNAGEAATTAMDQRPESYQERATQEEAQETRKNANEPKPDVSDQDQEELLPKLFAYFNNSREELARALGVHRSSVDRWMNGSSRPNNSTLLRMRRLAQERRIE